MAPPPALRAAAARLDHQAGRLPTVLDRVLVASGGRAWQGPAARRFADELAAHRRRLAAVADELRAVARRLHQVADGVEAGLRRQAAEAEAGPRRGPGRRVA